MGQRIRWWRDDVIYESTISCIDRQFLFVPNHRPDNPLLHKDCPVHAFDSSNSIVPVSSTINIIGSSVARALAKHPIQLHWFESSINHLHKGFSLLPDQLDNASRFFQHANSLIARQLNKLYQREGHFFAGRARRTPCVDDASAEQRLFYGFTDTLKDGLIDQWYTKNCTINKKGLVCTRECKKGCLMAWLDKLSEYLKKLLGQDVAIVPLAKGEAIGLPLYLTKKYTPYRLILFGRQIIVLRKQGVDTPSRVLMDIVKLREHFECDVAVVFNELASWERKRLIEKGVPFIVPGRQLFLPMLLIDLREHFPRGSAPMPAQLSRAAQQTVLRQIIKGDVARRPMAEVAALLGYSPMMMTKIRSELTTIGLCKEENRGRTRVMVFPQSSKQLWLSAAPKMRSPIYKRHFFVGKYGDMQLAGISALAKRSSLQPDTIVRTAVWKKRFESVTSENMLTEIETEDDADLIIEEWYYDPQRLSYKGDVDPFSLYLSLKDDPDERIQIAIEELLETIHWLEE